MDLLPRVVSPWICSSPARSTFISRLLSSSGLRGVNILFKSRRRLRRYYQHSISNRHFFSEATWR
ncbi:unnamed protein product [Brassica oleracea]